ncbi:melanoma-associated antigen F1 [Octodon degus]|uniref:Melanoma-associated antigen F1 n=1 Tax=Octodon degus TaxID=10160 RepID=A0A6P6D8Z4_OCTDE|nr:melanoma-associated antigen F1 [Octodon degus]
MAAVTVRPKPRPPVEGRRGASSCRSPPKGDLGAEREERAAGPAHAGRGGGADAVRARRRLSRAVAELARFLLVKDRKSPIARSAVVKYAPGIIARASERLRDAFGVELTARPQALHLHPDQRTSRGGGGGSRRCPDGSLCDDPGS